MTIKLKKGDHIYCEKGCKVAEANEDIKSGIDYISKFDFKFGTEQPNSGDKINHKINVCNKCGAPWLIVFDGGLRFFNENGEQF